MDLKRLSTIFSDWQQDSKAPLLKQKIVNLTILSLLMAPQVVIMTTYNTGHLWVNAPLTAGKRFIGIHTLSKRLWSGIILPLHGDVMIWFPSQMVSNPELWCFLWCWPRYAFKWMVEWPVIWDATSWCEANVTLLFCVISFMGICQTHKSHNALDK